MHYFKIANDKIEKNMCTIFVGKESFMVEYKLKYMIFPVQWRRLRQWNYSVHFEQELKYFKNKFMGR